ncbi:PH domain-containing protein [Microbacterium sp.]|uniref:PH domain-containing protein n=1 Tax=Microbacterium sp. TaxID=51671 RepID=UPI003736CE30
MTEPSDSGLFEPPGVVWQRVSPALAVVRRAGLLLLLTPLAAAVVVVAALDLLPRGIWMVLLVAILTLAAWGWWVIGRAVSRIGYAEQDDELYVTRGALFRKLVVVPYGRMQFVDVQAGPLDQLLGIAQVHVHTASPITGAVVPGLPREEAARLRDRLTVSGETKASGL